MGPSAQPSLIGLDWGTSSLRGYLFGADESVLESSTQPWGIQQLPAGGFKEAFRGVAGAWRERWPEVPVIAAGMVGSRQGWREAAYVDCPADLVRLADGVLRFDTEVGPIAIVPGVIQKDEFPNVMRGEETQIMGALAQAPALAARSLFVLPGTHSKWVTIRDGRIERFETFMTGELFAVLRDHSLLGRPARDAGAAAAATDAAAAFARGVAAARETGARGIAGRLFSTRSLFLTGDLAAGETLDYLSGLLLGEEIRSGLAGSGPTGRPPLALIGDPGLCGRYRTALAAFGVKDVRLLGDTAAAGLWTIARAAGFV